jgi:hypothetical protein
VVVEDTEPTINKDVIVTGFIDLSSLEIEPNYFLTKVYDPNEDQSHFGISQNLQLDKASSFEFSRVDSSDANLQRSRSTLTEFRSEDLEEKWENRNAPEQPRITNSTEHPVLIFKKLDGKTAYSKKDIADAIEKASALLLEL